MSETTLDWYRQVFAGMETADATGLRYLVIKDIEEVVPTVQIAEDEILPGFTNTSFTPQNIVKIKIDFSSPLFLITIGKARIGKGVTSGVFVEEFHRKTNYHIVAIDSGRELFTHKQPFAYDEPKYVQDKYDAWFAQFGLKRFGFNMIQITPKALGESSNIDKFFAFSYMQFKELAKYEPNEAKTILTELLCGNEATPANQILISRALNDVAVYNWESFYKKLLSLRKKQDANDPLASTAKTVFQGFISCQEDKWISDDPADHLDFVGLFNEYEFFNFVGRIRNMENDDMFMVRYNSCIKMFLTIILTDIVRFHQGAVGSRTKGAICWFPEIDSLVPKSGISSLKPLVSQLISKYGKYHISTVGDVQSVNKIDPTIFLNSSILSGKADEENLHVLEGRGLNETALDTFNSLPTKEPTSINTKASMFGFLQAKETIPTFFVSRPSCSQFFDEKRHSQI